MADRGICCMACFATRRLLRPGQIDIGHAAGNQKLQALMHKSTPG